MKIKKNSQSMYQKNVGKKSMLIVINRKNGKRNYALIKYFNLFQYNDSLHHEKKFFCRCCLLALSTEEICKRHVKGSFKINDTQKITMPKSLCNFAFHPL